MSENESILDIMEPIMAEYIALTMKLQMAIEKARMTRYPKPTKKLYYSTRSFSSFFSFTDGERYPRLIEAMYLPLIEKPITLDEVDYNIMAVTHNQWYEIEDKFAQYYIDQQHRKTLKLYDTLGIYMRRDQPLSVYFDKPQA